MEHQQWNVTILKDIESVCCFNNIMRGAAVTYTYYSLISYCRPQDMALIVARDMKAGDVSWHKHRSKSGHQQEPKTETQCRTDPSDYIGSNMHIMTLMFSSLFGRLQHPQLG